MNLEITNKLQALMRGTLPGASQGIETRCRLGGVQWTKAIKTTALCALHTLHENTTGMYDELTYCPTRYGRATNLVGYSINIVWLNPVGYWGATAPHTEG
jgi:hypothetical protein